MKSFPDHLTTLEELHLYFLLQLDLWDVNTDDGGEGEGMMTDIGGGGEGLLESYV